MIGKITDLEAAATGKKPRDTTRPPARMSPISQPPVANLGSRQSQYRNAAQALRDALGMNRIQYEEGSEITPTVNQSAAQSPITRTFANVLTTGGRRGGGKYGGFNTAADLESAVLGSTYELFDTTVPTLRAKAEPYLQQVQTMGTDAYRQAMNSVMGGVTGKIPAVPMGMTQAPEGSVYATRIEPLRQYKQQLSSWETEASKPAEEYLQTAEQIESTPMSELARSIAVNRYGMDPMLAAGKFANINDDYWKKERDAEYLAQYGKTYEQYKFEQDRLSDITAGGSKEKIAAATLKIEELTGLRATSLSEKTSQTPVQMVDNLSRMYRIPDPATGEMTEANGAGIVEMLRETIGSGNNRGLQDIYETLMASPSSEGMALLIAALVEEYVGGPQKTLEGLQDLGIFE